MRKTVFFLKPKPLKFKQFKRKGYALFACLGREVIVGVLSAATLSHASAKGISIRTELASDTLSTMKRLNLDEVQVMGTRAQLSEELTAKMVTVIPRVAIEQSGATTVNDLLKLVASVDVRQRGGYGVQTDISVNGGTFDQVTILLNGVDISNPQTGHNATNFPVSIQDIERIEVIEGAASRCFGSNAFSGAINIVTHIENQKNITLASEAGSYGTVGGTLKCTPIADGLSVSYDVKRSDGGTDNSDFLQHRLFAAGRLKTKKTQWDWQGAFGRCDFGANTFYSAKFNNQYEETRNLVASLKGLISVTKNLEIQSLLSWKRFRDHYQLTKYKVGSANGENYHILNIPNASLNFYFNSSLGRTVAGIDWRKESLWSTAYGDIMAEEEQKKIPHNEGFYTKHITRDNVGLYLEHNVIVRQWTVSAGFLANDNSALSGGFRFYPGVDVSWRPSDALKIYASWNKALRLPTYTDLYTSNVAQQGDTQLRPEKNSTLKLGVNARRGLLTAKLSGFYSRGRDMIDWVYETEQSTKYHALNIGKLDNLGLNADVMLRFQPKNGFYIQDVSVGYAFIHQTHETEHQIYRSLYALEYLKHKAVFQTNAHLWRSLSLHFAARWQQRENGFHPYWKLDAKLQWARPTYQIYVKADNLINHSYYDLGAVRQPGLWVMAGFVLKSDFFSSKNGKKTL